MGKQRPQHMKPPGNNGTLIGAGISHPRVTWSRSIKQIPALVPFVGPILRRDVTRHDILRLMTSNTTAKDRENRLSSLSRMGKTSQKRRASEAEIGKRLCGPDMCRAFRGAFLETCFQKSTTEKKKGEVPPTGCYFVLLSTSTGMCVI